MELQNELLEGQVKEKKDKEACMPNVESDSMQYNAQDLDQEQKVDVSPVQSNTQNLHVYVNNPLNVYYGRVTGTTIMEKTKDIIKNVDILLYFGGERKSPVYKTTSDNNGNFIIEDIPPGYYMIIAEEKEENLKYQSHYIKVLPGQSVHQWILLKKKHVFMELP